MSVSSPAAMQASIGLDLSQYESRSRTLVATTQRMAANVNQSIAGISRTVAGSGAAFDRLRAAIDPAFAATQRYRQIQQDLAAMVERGDATQRAANIALEQAASRYMGVATAAERAKQAEQEHASAVALSTGQYEALRASLDPVYAASKRYEAATEAMTAAVRNGAITQGQANQVLDMAAQKMLGIAPATKAAASATTAASTASRGLFASVGGGQNAMKQFSFQLNQVAQQGAVTGNYMQALSVQAADMLTVFGLWGILAGGAIAVLGPLAMSFFGVSDAARSLDDVMGDLSSSVGDIKGAIEQAAIPMAALRKEYGDSAEAAKRLYDVQLALGQLKAQNAMQEALEKVRASMGGVIGQVDLYQSLMAQIPDSVMAQNQQLGLSKNITEVLASNYGLTLDGALKAAGAARSMSEALRAGDMDAVARYASEMASSLGAARDASGKIPKDVLETAEAAGQLAVNALQYAGYTEQAERLASGLAINLDDAQTAAQQLASALSSAAAFSASLDAQVASIGVEIEALKTKANAANAVMVSGLEARAQANRNAAVAAGEDLLIANARYATDMAQIGTLKDLLAQKEQLIESNRTEARSAGSATRAAERLARQHERELEALRASLDPLEAYRQKLAKLVPLQAALSQDEFAQAVRNLNVELADSLPLVGDLSDAISTGLVDGFSGGLSSMTDALKSWLKQAIALAMKNQIVIGMGLTGSVSAGGTAAAAATGSALSGIGTAFSAISLGMSNFAGSIMSAAWGSISGAFSAGLAGLSTSVTTAFANLTGNVGALISGSGSSIAASLGALGSAIGAIAAPIAIIAGLVSFFGTKTKLLDAGIKTVISDTDVLVYTYKKVKKSKYWGLSSSKKTTTTLASDEVADPITRAIQSTQASILSMASVLGIASDTFDNFAYELKVSTKGLSDEEIGKALAAALSDAADAYALMIGGLDDLIAPGETATEALTRLSTALTTVTGAFDTLGYSLRYSGLAGAAVSSALQDLLGGADGFTSAVSTYWGTFYSAAEQQAILTRQATTALAAYNAALPRSRDEYRALIDAQDLTTEAGRKLWAALVGMAGVMDQILPTVSDLTAELEPLLGAVSTNLDATISAVTESQRAAATAAGNWAKAAETIGDFIRSMRSTSGALVSPAQALSASRAQYQAGLASALAGDLDAVTGLTGVAQTYLDNVGSTAGTAVELALAQARVLADLGTVQGTSGAEGARWEVMQGLYQDQVDLMTEVRDAIAAGNALSEAQIATLNARLGTLDGALGAASGADAAPMVALRSALEALATAVEAETARAARETAVTRLNTYAAGLTADASGAYFVTDADLAEMARLIGYDSTGKTAEQIRQSVAGYDAADLVGSTIYDPTGSREAAYLASRTPAAAPAAPALSRADYAFSTRSVSGRDKTAVTGPLGTERIYNSYWQALGDVEADIARGIPSFARGGTHAGGPAYIGENDLELVAPSRVYNPSETRSMLDNRQVVEELRALREELRALKEESRQLGLQTADNTRSIAKITRKWDVIGQPPVQGSTA